MRRVCCVLLAAVLLVSGTAVARAADQGDPGSRTITDRNKSQRLGNEPWDTADPYGRFGDRSRGAGERYIDRLPDRQPGGSSSGQAPWGQSSSPWGGSGTRPVR